jgi:hypothetical protein
VPDEVPLRHLPGATAFRNPHYAQTQDDRNTCWLSPNNAKTLFVVVTDPFDDGLIDYRTQQTCTALADVVTPNRGRYTIPYQLGTPNLDAYQVVCRGLGGGFGISILELLNTVSPQAARWCQQLGLS